MWERLSSSNSRIDALMLVFKFQISSLLLHTVYRKQLNIKQKKANRNLLGETILRVVNDILVTRDRPFFFP